jgi:biopolymer transport protein ExbD
MRIPSHATDRAADVNLTPMIDVVFQLLVFFICTASLQVDERLLVSRLASAEAAGGPAADDPRLRDLEQIVVRLRWIQGQVAWEVNREPYAELPAVGAVLRAAYQIEPNLPVIIDPDGQVPLAAVIDVYDLSRLAGFATIQFAAAE